MDKYQEGLERVKTLIDISSDKLSDKGKALMMESVNTLQQLVDKATPKKKIQTSKLTYICPCCLENDIKNFVYGNYCDECGQRLE